MILNGIVDALPPTKLEMQQQIEIATKALRDIRTGLRGLKTSRSSAAFVRARDALVAMGDVDPTPTSSRRSLYAAKE